MITQRRLPGEFERHSATWVAWPHNPETWPGCLEQAETEFANLVAEIGASEPVRVLVKSDTHAERVRGMLAELPPATKISLHPVPTDDAWVRDTGPTFAIEEDGSLVALSWNFNAWGEKYPPWDQDDAVALEIARIAGVPCLRPGLVAEGGALETDGQGTLIATEATLVDPARNPGLGREAIEEQLTKLLGLRKVIWLDACIQGDDTDGHIDDIARFVAPGRVLCSREPDPQDSNHAALEDCRARLRAARDGAGRALEVIDLPMPSGLEHDGERMPASYANFYVANRAVLVPVFDVPEDKVALELLRSQFPTRRISPIPAAHLVRGLGTVHCLTQQQPATDRA